MSESDSPEISASTPKHLTHVVTANAAVLALVLFASFRRFSGALADYQWARIAIFIACGLLSSVLIWLCSRRLARPVAWPLLFVVSLACWLGLLWVTLQIRAYL